MPSVLMLDRFLVCGIRKLWYEDVFKVLNDVKLIQSLRDLLDNLGFFRIFIAIMKFAKFKDPCITYIRVQVSDVSRDPVNSISCVHIVKPLFLLKLADIV